MLYKALEIDYHAVAIQSLTLHNVIVLSRASVVCNLLVCLVHQAMRPSAHARLQYAPSASLSSHAQLALYSDVSLGLVPITVSVVSDLPM